MIQDELDRMNRYVDDLLLLTKAARPDFLRLGPLDLDLFTHDLFAKARSLGDRDWRLDGTGVGIVVADQHRLTQAVMNLAENAVRHTRDGEPIWIGSSLDDHEARLWVRDEGPGVDPGRPRADLQPLRPRRLERRRRRRRRRARALDRRAIAEAHGGRVELDSQPRRRARPSRSCIPAAPRPVSRILIAEDEARLASLPREGPAGERLHDHGRRRRARPPAIWRATRISTC